MRRKLTTYAAVIALSTVTAVAAFAASPRDPAQDQRENQVTSQLNQQQLGGGAYGYVGGGYGTETYEGIMQSSGPNQGSMQEQIAAPPDASDLSLIE
jgi:hypothetical protein